MDNILALVQIMAWHWIGVIHWRIYAALGGDELKMGHLNSSFSDGYQGNMHYLYPKRRGWMIIFIIFFSTKSERRYWLLHDNCCRKSVWYWTRMRLHMGKNHRWVFLKNFLTYRQFSNIKRTQSPNINVSRLVLQLSLPNPLKPRVKLRMKMELEQRGQAMLQLHLSDQQCYFLLRCILY